MIFNDPLGYKTFYKNCIFQIINKIGDEIKANSHKLVIKGFKSDLYVERGIISLKW